ncbi:MAG TPA: ATP-binding protein [Kineosporiaceae bacterium]|nr:ATP-binding protein [Kineosporiaceae bacterium]
MSRDPLLESLRTAVETAPEDVALRLHLARLLSGAGEHGEAVRHAAVILQHDPSHQGALELVTGQATSAPPALATQDAAAPVSDEELLRRLDTEFTGVIPPMYVESSRFPGFDREHRDDEPDRLDELDDGLAEILDAFTTEVPDLTLADVAGMDEVKARLEAAVLAPIRNPDLVKLYAKSLRGGLLLYGPPGCGKTFIARALAGEIGARLLSVSLADVLDMYIGQSERNLRAIFEIARHSAPCVIFLDEIDALGQKRSQLRSSASRGTVNQLLTEMDGLASDNEGVYVLGATNHPWDVDVALRRPGRFDRMILVLPPDEPAREAVLRYSLRDRPIAGVDTGVLARMTAGYSGADLAFVCESAAERALLDSVRTGRPRMIQMSDLEAAVHDSRPSIGPWLQTARNVAEFGNADGSYDDLLTYLRSRKMA